MLALRKAIRKKYKKVEQLSKGAKAVYETVEHKDGSIFKGNIISEDDSTILFMLRSSSDTLSFNKSTLKDIERIEDMFLGDSYTLQETNGFTTTAFNLEKGEKRYRNVWFFYNDYSQGISDNLSFTTGFMDITRNNILRVVWRANCKIKNIHTA